MLQTLQLISPIFGVALIGYVAGRAGVIDEHGIRGLSRFAFRIAIPAMLIRAVSELELSFEWELLTVYFGGTFLVFGAGILAGRLLFRHAPDRRVVFGFGSAFSNNLMVGIPFVQAAFGDAALLPLYIILSIHGPVLYMVGTSLLRAARGAAESEPASLPTAVLRSQLRNPIFVALAIGFALNLTGIRLMGPVDTVASMLGAAAIPATLFTLGASLAGYRIAGELDQAAVLIGLKNLLHPLVVYALAFHVFALDPVWSAVTVAMAAMPMGINAYLFASDSEVLAPTMAASVVASTGVSVVSLSLLLLLLP